MTSIDSNSATTFIKNQKFRKSLLVLESLRKVHRFPLKLQNCRSRPQAPKFDHFGEINLKMGPIRIKKVACLIIFILTLICNYLLFSSHHTKWIQDDKDSPFSRLLEAKENYQKNCRGNFNKLSGLEEPMMSSKSKSTLNKVMDIIAQRTQGTGIYLEWGSGGSTRLALTKNFGHLYSIENSGPYWISLSGETKIKCAMKEGFLDYIFGNGGNVREFGNPTDPNSYNSSAYIDVIDTFDAKKFDIVLVDGRFRVACALKVWDRLNPGAILMIHDFHTEERRLTYHPNVYKFYEDFQNYWLGERGELGVFKKRDKVSYQELTAALEQQRNIYH